MEQGVYVLSVTPERSQRKSGSSGSRVRLNPQPHFGPLQTSARSLRRRRARPAKPAPIDPMLDGTGTGVGAVAVGMPTSPGLARKP